ncbi:nucleotidyltransferase substrate binding protein [Thermophagus xiamenensis]|uniref:Nucleotidyltransferase substrate binding protein, HI0074 family n=1 Tax=Thermophagus xiamenensis TaxID=385682 RepID=A0A1I2DNS2_9BACT|nr:nucleotidyltransferase substrate binding protein [Thermophagus xiamenensis]SFE82088.1 nucleotidyltransferase substrate binding protein, HI0074 family [Thermophagus xiamenensis]
MDIRWKQRYNNYKKALEQLSRFLKHTTLNEMEEQGLIQAFEYTFELAWKTLQDVLEEESGYEGIKGPRPVIKQAFKDGLISDGEKWMEMLKDRNRSSHTYDEDTAQEIIDAIRQVYYSLFCQLDSNLRQYL